jgi:ribonuclease PH
VQRTAPGSVLVRWGETHVICSAAFEDRVPQHRLGTGGGWLSAEYGMLPGAGAQRVKRERPNVSGRTAEIQRLIGRSLRAVIDVDRIGVRTLWIDCDVIQADGGTRCAAITGSWLAARLAIEDLSRKGHVPPQQPQRVAAVSVGVVDGRVVTDLCYAEDSTAEVDLNFVATPKGIVEIQGTAEGRPFGRHHLDTMLEHASAAVNQLFELQQAAWDATRAPRA